MEEFEILKSVAIRDFKDSRQLFKKKRYANAIFLLEQADEKAGKAVLSHIGLILTSGQIDKIIQFLGSHPTMHTNQLIQMLNLLRTATDDTEWKTIKNKYGHDWLRSFLRVLAKIAEPIDGIASKTGLLQTLQRGLDPKNPAVSTMTWQAVNWKERVAKVQERFKKTSKILRSILTLHFKLSIAKLRVARSSSTH